MNLSPGAVVAQRYELAEQLGEGGMGTVWAAKHVLTQKRVALKFLKEAAQPELVRRFVREARAASAVHHPNVVGIHDVLMLEEGVPAMVMDLLEGESLAARLERAGPLDTAELASIMVPVLSAVGAAHALGIVHRDLKPDNVFLSLEAESGQIRPMVLDFGICKLMTPEALLSDESTLTRTGSVMGTPYYMAPEQVFGERDLDARADVWAIGVMLYECCTGQRPFDGENIGQLIKHVVSGSFTPLLEAAPGVPPRLASAIQHMLLHDRAQRSPDLREIFDTLQQLSHVSARGFGAAAKIRATPASELPAATVRVQKPSPLAASGVGTPVTSNIERRKARSQAWLAGLALVLLGAGSTVMLRRTVFPPNRASQPLPTGAASAPPMTQAASPPVPLTALPLEAAPSASAHPEPSRGNARAPRANASSAPAKVAPRTLPGGVHPIVPF